MFEAERTRMPSTASRILLGVLKSDASETKQEKNDERCLASNDSAPLIVHSVRALLRVHKTVTS